MNTFTILTPGGSAIVIDPESIHSFVFSIGEHTYELTINKR